MSSNFLERVLPDTDGYICVCGYKGDDPRQKFVKTFEEAYEAADQFSSEERNVYFGCARYTEAKRNLTTVQSKKVFYIDLDCGASKPYADQGSAASDLADFCDTTKLPLPTLVNSGNGLHAYWILTELITSREWLAVAQSLKNLCKKHKLKADAAVTSNNAAILRMPGYLNRKDTEGKMCEVLQYSKDVKFEDFKNIVGEVALGPGGVEKKEEYVSNKKSVFSNIISECQQLKYSYENQAFVDYTLWRATESIIKYCVDSDEWKHKVSEKHPNYNYEATEKLFDGIKGPYHCETIEGIRPEGCEGCPHKNKITSPIQLGDKVFKDTEKKDVEEKKQVTSNPSLEALTVPELPFPYVFGENDGVFIRADEEDKPECVYEHNLGLVQRYKDPMRGEVVLIKHKLPMDGEKAILLAAKELIVGDEAKKILAHHGVLTNRKKMEQILNYIINSFKNLQNIQEAITMRLQFGWADDYKKFIVGEKEIGADTVAYCPPSSAIEKFVPALRCEGDLETWKNISATYGKHDMYPQAFAFFTGFGSPLLKFLHYEGAIINLVNNTSGTGKTTALKMALSVWGDPKELLFIRTDTQNAKMHTIGVFNSLPVGIDEVTSMTGEAFSDVLFALTQGRGKARMEKSSNSIRYNATKWATIGVTTSNSSMVDKLRATKQTPDGELMRFIEFDVPQKSPITKEEANKIFDEQVAKNYGLAGPLYAQYIIKNKEAVIEELKKTQKLIDKKVGFSSRERFWSAVIACNITGAMIAKRMGLLPKELDIGKVNQWVCDNMQRMRQDIQAPSGDHAATIGEFINENRTSILVVNEEVDMRSRAECMPVIQPRGNRLCIRIEPDTKKMYITSKYLKKYCADNQITLRDVLASLTQIGAFVKSCTKRIDKGLETTTPAVNCYMFDCSVEGFIDLDGYVKELVDDDTGS